MGLAAIRKGRLVGYKEMLAALASNMNALPTCIRFWPHFSKNSFKASYNLYRLQYCWLYTLAVIFHIGGGAVLTIPVKQVIVSAD